MDRINANDFRANLKEWMDAACQEPVKITRKSGESFVLLNSDEFEKIQVELASLRGLAQGLSDVIQGRTQQSNSLSTAMVLDRAKNRVHGAKVKKAAG